MKMKRHYGLPLNDRLVRFLEENGVPYKVYPYPESSKLYCVFDMYEDQESWRIFKIKFIFCICKEDVIWPEYTKSEIENAEWLSVRSKWKRVEWEYRESAFRLSCEYTRLLLRDKRYKHAEQIKPFTVTKPMKWGHRMYFSGPNAADDILFCSDQARSLLDGR